MYSLDTNHKFSFILGASHKIDKTIDVIVYILPSKTYAFGNRVQLIKLIRQYDEFSKF